MFCHSCGAQIPDGSTFCATCGSSQNAAPQAAPQQQPYAAPQQPYAAPQQPYAAPQQAYVAPKKEKFDLLNSMHVHNILSQFGVFIVAGILAIMGILLFTGCQYGYEYGFSIAYDGYFEVNPFAGVVDWLFGFIFIAAALAQVYFWFQLNNKPLGGMPALGLQKAMKFYPLVNLGIAGISFLYMIFQGLMAAFAFRTVYGDPVDIGLEFDAPWIGILVMHITFILGAFTYIYYKNIRNKVQ